MQNGTPARAEGAAPWVATGAPAPAYDTIIMGGGLAGLTLALQLVRTYPGHRVAVLERDRHPAPDAAFKVGESSNEMAEHYWRSIGLGDVLSSGHIRKLGLRYIVSDGDNTDLSRRVEAGARTFMFSKTWQIDRGRFENEIAVRAAAAGAEIFDGTKVASFDIDGEAGHRVVVERAGQTHELAARWLIDASGRRNLIKRKLRLADDVDHDVNAVWWRLGETIELDDFGAHNAGWRRLVPSEGRWQSTNHLMGRGYWVWLIPLSSGAISVGIVADPRWVPYEEIATFEKACAWLRRNEPQLADAVEARRHTLMDFHGLKHFAYGCRQVFSADRWAMTGVSGVFLDPLYSPGSDFIGLANNYITDLIGLDLAGDPRFAERAARASDAFVRLFRNALPTWKDQYGLMGNGQVWPAKVAWDTMAYFTVLGLNFVSGGTWDLDHMAAIRPIWERFFRLTHHMQWFLRRWDALDDGRVRRGFMDMSQDTLRYFNAFLVDGVPKEELHWRLRENVQFMEMLAVGIMAGAARQLGVPVDDDEIDPYTFGLGAVDPGSTAPSPYRSDPLPRHPRPELLERYLENLFGLEEDRDAPVPVEDAVLVAS